MALLQTQLLPGTLTQPNLPRQPPANAPLVALQAYVRTVHNYMMQQKTTIQSMYNSIVQASAGQTLVGLDADLPTAGQPGRTFFATDSLKFYVDSGSAWHFTTLT